MHLEYRNDPRKTWNQEDSGAKSTLIDSTFSSVPAKRFQRSNSKNCHHNYQSPSAISENKSARPISMKGPSVHHDLSSPQLKPTLPNSPTHVVGQGNNFSIFSPQYIKIPRSPNNFQGEQRQTKNHSVLIPQTNTQNRIQPSIKSSNDWKPTDFKKLSDLNPRKTIQKGKQNILTNSNKNPTLNNSSNSFFSKAKESNIYITSAEKIKKQQANEQEDPVLTNSSLKILQLEENNQNMAREMQILKKQKQQIQKELQKYKKQKEVEKESSKQPFWLSDHAGKDKKLFKNSHNRSVGEINKNKSLKETALSHQLEHLKDELEKIKSENGFDHFEHIIIDLQEQNSFYKKELDAINLRCRILDQQNRSMGEKWKDIKKLQSEIRYLKASLEDSEEQMKRLKGENKKLRAVNMANNNFLDPRGSIIGSMNMPSETDSLNLSMSWMQK